MDTKAKKYWDNFLYNKCIKDKRFLQAIAHYLEAQNEKEELEK